jgi:hypothetical protein
VTVDVMMKIKGPMPMRSTIETNRPAIRKFISTSEWAENIIDQPVNPAVKALLKSIFCLMSEPNITSDLWQIVFSKKEREGGYEAIR